MVGNPRQFLSRTGYLPVDLGAVTGVVQPENGGTGVANNPGDSLTFQGDAFVSGTNTGDSDFLSGVYFIASGDEKTIPLYSQMIVKGGSLIIDGVLNVDGQLYLEA